MARTDQTKLRDKGKWGIVHLVHVVWGAQCPEMNHATKMPE